MEKDKIFHLIEELPEELLPELLVFLEFLAWKAAREMPVLSTEETEAIDRALEDLDDPACWVDHEEVLKQQKTWVSK